MIFTDESDDDVEDSPDGIVIVESIPDWFLVLVAPGENAWDDSCDSWELLGV